MYLYCTDSLLFGPLGSAGGAEGCGVLLEAADKNKHVSESQMSLMSHELTSMIQPYWHSLVLIQQADDHQKQPHRNKLSGRSWRSGVILVLWGGPAGSDRVLLCSVCFIACLAGSVMSSCRPQSLPPSHGCYAHQEKHQQQQQADLYWQGVSLCVRASVHCSKGVM